MSDLLLKSKIDSDYRAFWILIPLMWSPLLISIPLMYLFTMNDPYVRIGMGVDLRNIAILCSVVFAFLVWPAWCFIFI